MFRFLFSRIMLLIKYFTLIIIKEDKSNKNIVMLNLRRSGDDKTK